MAYSIYIGERVPNSDLQDAAWNNRPARVRPEKLDAAPAWPHDTLSQHSNGRFPSYGGWYEFAEITGLTTLFYDPQQGLMVPHPGIRTLERQHLAILRHAALVYLAAHPTATAETDPQVLRLTWLIWWVTWALENCADPAIENW